MKNQKRVVETLKVRNSRKTYIPIYLMIIILISILIYLTVMKKPLNSLTFKLILAFSLISISASEIHRLYDSYELIRSSLVHTKGYFTKESRKMDLSAISDLLIVQNIWQRIFSYGNINVTLFSGENAIQIKNINNPSHLVDKILERLNREVSVR